MRTILAAALCAALTLPAAAPAGTAAADTGADGSAPRLRSWCIGLQGIADGRDRWDVFNRDDLPPAAVDDRGRGLGLQVGRRFGGRFLLGLQFTVAEHEMQDLQEQLYAGEFLLTGTVLFHERGTLQPFVRGGVGGGVAALDRPGGDGSTFSIGTAALAGGGVQLRLGSRVSLEAEAAATFTNFLEVHDVADDGVEESEWRVKTSQAGWRTGVGLVFWF